VAFYQAWNAHKGGADVTADPGKYRNGLALAIQAVAELYLAK
jgi:hypothetical protein